VAKYSIWGIKKEDVTSDPKRALMHVIVKNMIPPFLAGG
jgi:hypothetical protein